MSSKKTPAKGKKKSLAGDTEEKEEEINSVPCPCSVFRIFHFTGHGESAQRTDLFFPFTRRRRLKFVRRTPLHPSPLTTHQSTNPLSGLSP
jgi:hypothetical protein